MPQVITIAIEQIADFPCNVIVIVPREIQTIYQTAPSIKAPVNPAASAIRTQNKSRGNISCPSIIGGTFDQSNFWWQHGSCGFILLIADQHGDLFGCCNGSCNFGKGCTGSIAAISPRISSFWPNHDTAQMGSKFCRHPAAVLFG